MAVELVDVGKSFDNGTTALKSVSLKFYAGQTVAITGRSGSGKSTLLNILGLLDMPTSGALIIGNDPDVPRDDRTMSAQRAAHLGFIFQRSHLIAGLSTLENVLLGLRYTNQPVANFNEMAEKALDEVGLGQKVADKARTLSGGEMQRVAIARTLARPADLWLADEPTGNLDSAQSLEIIELLKERAVLRGACLVVVTHEPDIAARMERVITLQDGEVISDSAPFAPQPGTESAQADAAALNRVQSGVDERRLSRIKRTLYFARQGVRAYPGRVWSGAIAAAVAVGMAVVALGLAQSAASQVTNLFDSQRATQVTAQFTRDVVSEPRWPIRLDRVSGFAGVRGAEYWEVYDGVPVANGALASDRATVNAVSEPPGQATNSEVLWAPGARHSIGPGQAVVGSLLAERLSVSQFGLGPDIQINGSTFTVVGVLQSSRVATARGAAFIAPADASSMGPAVTAVIFAETVPGGARQLADRIALLADPYMSARVEIDPVLEASAYQGQLEASVDSSLKAVAVVAALAGLVVLVFVNILGVSSRIAEFGVRRAFGARRGELILLVASESAYVSLVGAVMGLSAGFLVVMSVTAAARWQPVFEPVLLLAAFGMAAILGVLAGIPPAVAAGRVQPADAVRT